MPSPFVSVVNLGCRVNRVESDRISTELARDGFALVSESDADLVVINTCAVTGEAEAKTRKAVRHALSLPRHPIVLVTGCVVNLHPEELTDLSERVVAEPSKVDVPARVRDIMGDPLALVGAPSSSCGPDLSELLGRSRLGIKIQDGCNHRCTYCIVWKARGPERSVPVPHVLDQVREAESFGIPEVVLTGVNLGAYDGADEGDAHVEIDELLDRILEHTSIPHVRLSSIEPMDVSERLIERMAASRDRVAPFLHLPIQSGCTETLRRMGRPYTAERLLEQVGQIRAILPEVSLSCDVIVGFPGETDEEFERSLDLCRQIGFSRMHVFRYSKRPGTIAATAPDQVDPAVMAERSARMRSLADEMARRDAASRVGTIEGCVLEHGNRGTLASFQRVVVDGVGEDATGLFVRVCLTGIEADGSLRGELVREG
ncbi:MAG: MiaB/RimO family radical SAM methylthiotransferase [Collinsella sp.]|nr:MiaB/RimO family radical SAM methylthiotransferase [Collinsella sp.]